MPIETSREPSNSPSATPPGEAPPRDLSIVTDIVRQIVVELRGDIIAARGVYNGGTLTFIGQCQIYERSAEIAVSYWVGPYFRSVDERRLIAHTLANNFRRHVENEHTAARRAALATVRERNMRSVSVEVTAEGRQALEAIAQGQSVEETARQLSRPRSSLLTDPLRSMRNFRFTPTGSSSSRRRPRE